MSKFTVIASVSPTKILTLLMLVYETYQHCEFFNDLSARPFHKIKNCHRSNLPVISRSNARSISGCMDFAKERGGLAINFSPPGASVSKYYHDNFFANCLVLGCPEIVNSSTFVNDSAFDYYSLYGDLDALINTSCVKSVGIFRVFEEKVNYTTAIMKCQENGGDLADIVSEARTNGISMLVHDGLKDWYKMAYVGLDDRKTEARFVTPMGEPLSCFKFRAWAPGHPRNKKKYEDCAVIDSENSWKVMNCLGQQSFVCELYPMSPPKMANFKNVSCSELVDKEKRMQCRAAKKEHATALKGETPPTQGGDRCKNQL